jgi:MFS family permease
MEGPGEEKHVPKPTSRIADWHFSLTMVSVCLIAFIASIGSSIATALPKISNELHAGQNYVWIASIYMFAQTAVQPPCAQLCDIFGRKNPMIISLLVFAAGSAVAAASNTTAALLAGRLIQGLASGCIMMLSELIVCDLVPLRERGKYVGFVLTAIALGTVVGPITSGALAEHHWRWV